jgi:multiple sugar transport system ATP-binding protein
VILAGGTRRMTVPEAVVRRLRGLRSHVGGHLVLGLRPEAIGVDPSRTTGRPLDLPVAAVEPLGHRVLVHLEAEGAGLQLAESGAAVPGRAERIGTATFVRREETLVASLPAHERVRPGELLRVYVDLERAHFFDPATQLALR